jgi:hypothetical protein
MYQVLQVSDGIYSSSLLYQVLQVSNGIYSDGEFFHSFMVCFVSICIQ